MTIICACNYPVWLYDKNNKEYFSIPFEVAEGKGIQYRPDLGDLEIVINRDSQDIKFLAIPMSTIEERGLQSEIPEIEMVDHETNLSDGTAIVRQFMKIVWLKISDESTKKYDVRGHIFIAGCKPSDMIKEKELDLEGKEKEVLHCSEKGIFVVLHPIDEFLEKHIVELENIK
jgi:hypothetical protein